jgi:TPR repeat protein
MAAYEKSQFQDAAKHLEQAVALAPDSVRARLYLANTYDQLYCETCECESNCDVNDHWRIVAIAAYKKVLELEPANTQALNHLAHRFLWHADYDEAEHYYRRSIEADTNNTEALYTLAYLGWFRSYKLRTEKRATFNLERRQSLIRLPICADVRTQNLARVEESMSLLARTLRIINAPEAIDYMALLYQERADIQCGDAAARRRDLKNSALWERRGCKTRLAPNVQRVPWPWPPSPPPSEKASKCIFKALRSRS